MTRVISTRAAFQLSITSGSCQLTIFVVVEQVERLALKAPNELDAHAAVGRESGVKW
jgi:hypothetical protein